MNINTKNIQNQAKQLQVAAKMTQKVNDSVLASDNFTEADRKVAETFEACELFAEFLANERL